MNGHYLFSCSSEAELALGSWISSFPERNFKDPGLFSPQKKKTGGGWALLIRTGCSAQTDAQGTPSPELWVGRWVRTGCSTPRPRAHPAAPCPYLERTAAGTAATGPTAGPRSYRSSCGPGWDQVPPPGPPKAGDATGSQWEAGPRARPSGARTGKLPGLPLRRPRSNPPVAPRASTSFCSARSRGWEVRGNQ